MCALGRMPIPPQSPDPHLHDMRHDAATRFWKEHKDFALLRQLLADRDIKSYVNIGGKEASRLMRKRKAG
jgi:hypothetical protein